MPLDLEFGKFIKKIEDCKDLDIEDGKCKQYKKRE